MAVLLAKRTNRNTVKPVGESVLCSMTHELLNSTGNVTYIYDYEIPSGLVLTSLEAIKTVDDASATQRATIQVYKVTPGVDASATEVLLSEIYAPATTKKGTKLFATTYANGTSGDPELQVKANETAVGGLTKQRVRIKLSIATVAQQNISLSYLAKLKFATFVNSAYQNSDSNEITTN